MERLTFRVSDDVARLICRIEEGACVGKTYTCPDTTPGCPEIQKVLYKLAFPAADVVEEENVLKFYYVRSIDEYWIGRRIDNFYYAEYDPKSRQWVWTHSRYLPWGEHIVSPTSLWKEHTYPSEPEEISFAEWLQGFIKKYVIVDEMDGGVNDAAD